MIFALNVKMPLVAPVVSAAQKSSWHNPPMLSGHTRRTKYIWQFKHTKIRLYDFWHDPKNCVDVYFPMHTNTL